MEKNCTDILKDNLMEIANAEQKEELQELFSKEIEIPPSGCFDVDSDPDYITLDTLFNDYMNEDDRKEIGLE